METMAHRDWALLEHFSPDEFRCHCGCRKGVRLMQVITMKRLSLARKLAGVPFFVTSGYRCIPHHEFIGGVANSAHTRGYAVDISTNFYHPGYNKDRLRYLILASLLHHFNRIGIADTFIHVDDDPDKNADRIWLY